jgi:Flp pilus assembly protein TadG
MWWLSASLSGRRVRALAACPRGASAVEFALLAPVLLLLFAGILVFGIYLGAAHNLRQLAAEAARASVAGVTDQERAALAQGQIRVSLAAGSMFRPGSIGVQVGSDPADATLYTVTLSFDASALGLGGVARLVPMPPDLMRSSISVRRGGL